MRDTPQQSRLPPSVRRWQERQQRREVRMRRAEGPAVPVIITMLLGVLLALAGGWLAWSWNRKSLSSLASQAVSQVRNNADDNSESSGSPSNAAEQLNRRLEALQINRTWFRRLMQAAEATAVADQEAWLVLIQQLPLSLQLQLGRLRDRDLRLFYRSLEQDGINHQLFEQAVHTRLAQFIKISDLDESDLTVEPWRQLWLATAIELQSDFKPKLIKLVKGSQDSRPIISHGYLEPGESAVFKIEMPGVGVDNALVDDGHYLTTELFGSNAMTMTVVRNGTIVTTSDDLPVEEKLPLSLDDDLSILIANQGLAGGYYYCSTILGDG